jgi:8-oxo-dGTP pyrophosphatase MutT (NUDIX family)
VSLHSDALALLEGWEAPDQAQEALRRRYVGHLRARPDGLRRGCRPDHVTASTLVVDPAGSQVLLTLHARAGRWFQLGGHCETGDTTLAGAALREASEESGLTGLVLDPEPVQLSEHAVPFCRPDGADDGASGRRGVTHHLDVRFLAVAPSAGGHVRSAESADLAWWPVGALPSPEPGMVELVELAGRRLAAQRLSGSGSSSPGGGSISWAADQPSR